MVVDVFELVVEFLKMVVGGFGCLWVVPSFGNYAFNVIFNILTSFLYHCHSLHIIYVMPS